jgi:hypothetical protein
MQDRDIICSPWVRAYTRIDYYNVNRLTDKAEGAHKGTDILVTSPVDTHLKEKTVKSVLERA